MSKTRHFYISARKMADKPHHYRLCGLDNIYLLNGFTIHKTGYGPGVSIHNAEDLEKAIGLTLSIQNEPLSPDEFKFLRKNMEMTQEELGARFGVKRLTIIRYETGESPIPVTADRLMRYEFILHILRPEARELLLDYIRSKGTDADQDLPPPHICAVAGGWEANSAH